jgi:multiple sugar transport system permease protein
VTARAGAVRGRGLLLLAAPALALLFVLQVAPILEAVRASLFLDTPFAPSRFVGLEHYRALAGDPVLRGTLSFTLLFAAVTVTLEVLLGLALALVMNASYRGRGLARAAVLLPWALPTVVAGVLWKYLLNDQYGALNLLVYGADVDAYRAWLAHAESARWAVILADVWKTSAVPALLILAGLQSMPEELHEAARLDGAGPVRRFALLTVPHLVPALLLAVLFRSMDAFRVFDLVYVMTQGGPGDATNVLQLHGYRTLFPEQRYGYGSAISVLVFLIIAAVSLVTVRLLGWRLLGEPRDAR